MAIVKSRMTEDEFMRIPDDGRKYELVDGEPKEVPASFEHDVIGITVASLIRPHARGRGVVAGAQAGFRMRDRNIRCPDVSYTSRERIPGGKPPNTFGVVAPDLCIEIISPSEDKADMALKVNEYFDAGARFVWHMRPEPQTITVFTSPTNSVILSADDEIDAGDLLPTFRCRVADLFDDGLD